MQKQCNRRKIVKECGVWQQEMYAKQDRGERAEVIEYRSGHIVEWSMWQCTDCNAKQETVDPSPPRT